MDIKSFGFEKIALCTPKISVGSPKENIEEILKGFFEAEKNGAGIVVFPELCISGKSCGSLFHQGRLIKDSLSSLLNIADKTKESPAALIVGLPVKIGFKLYDCAAVIQKGEIKALIPAMHLDKSLEGIFSKAQFRENPVKIGGKAVPFGNYICRIEEGAAFSVQVGSDIFAPCPIGIEGGTLEGADLVINIGAYSSKLTKHQNIKETLKDLSRRGLCAYFVCSSGVGEADGNDVFSGERIGYELGKELIDGERFKKETAIDYAIVDLQKIEKRRSESEFFRTADEGLLPLETALSKTHLEEKDFNMEVDPLPFVPKNKEERGERAKDALNIQSFALYERLRKIGVKKCIIGVSGGLDSTLALLVCEKAMELLGEKAENVIGVTMPGFGTSDKTKNNAVALMSELNITQKEIRIDKACRQHFKDIGHSEDIHDITYENSQARERTQILMDLGNKENALVIGTGDLSELSLGWCTFGGDQISMFGVNSSVPKTFMRMELLEIAEIRGGKIGEILKDIVDTPVSPELLPPDEKGEISQKTEEKIGPYELHDFFLYNFIRNGFSKDKIMFLSKRAFKDQYTEGEIERCLEIFIKRFFQNQFKRSCAPDGVSIGSVSLSPKGDFSMPSDVSYKEWLK